MKSFQITHHTPIVSTRQKATAAYMSQMNSPVIVNKNKVALGIASVGNRIPT